MINAKAPIETDPMRKKEILLVAVLLGFLAIRLVHAAIVLPPTYDEHKHSQTGYVFLATGECCYGMSDTAMTAIHGWPWVLRDRLPWPPRINPGEAPERLSEDSIYPAIHQLNSESRMSTVVLALVLACFVFALGRHLGGSTSGLFALMLFIASPNLSAHGCLVSTDYHGTFAIFVATTMAYFAVARGMRLSGCLLTALGLTLALISKYTALFLLGLIPMFAAIPAWQKKNTWSKSIVFSTLTISLGLIGVFAVYRLPSWFGGLRLIDADQNAFLNPSTWPEALRGYWGGLALPRAMAKSGVANYFHGEFGTTWRLLYPAVLLLKTPLGILILALIGAGSLFHCRRGVLGVASITLAPAIIFGVSCMSKVTFALRYILPVWPFLMILSGLGAKWLWSKGRTSRVIAGILLGWAIFDGVRCHPFSLAYTNELLGRGRETARWFADSNVDWGQGLIALADELKERHIEELYLSYHGGISPELYGISALPKDASGHRLDWVAQYRPLPSDVKVRGWVAISLTHWVGLYYPAPDATAPDAFRWLREFEPVDLLGGSILLYNIQD